MRILTIETAPEAVFSSAASLGEYPKPVISVLEKVLITAEARTGCDRGQ
jgi:hypothetical protein